MQQHQRPRILIGLTGSVATVKCRELIHSFLDLNYDVRVVATKSALHFVALSEDYDVESKIRLDDAIALRRKSSASSTTTSTTTNTEHPSFSFEDELFLTDEDEWKSYRKVGGGLRGPGDPVLHIELRKWADVFLIAPLSANTLAKLSSGICDNLLTSIARAWEFTSSNLSGDKPRPTKPLIVAPAMNTAMWRHPHTLAHLSVLASLGFVVIKPVQKVLACGDLGDGALAPITEIVLSVQECISSKEKALILQTEEELQKGFTRC